MDSISEGSLDDVSSMPLNDNMEIDLHDDMEIDLNDDMEINLNEQDTSGEHSYASHAPEAPDVLTGEGPEMHECVGSCGEYHDSTSSTILECNHTWCYDCLSDFFYFNILEKRTMPTCCKIPMHIGKVVPLLDDVTQELFWEQFEMLEDVSRLYCYKPGCYKYISNETRTDKVGTCGCGAQTCVKCEGEAHPGKECKEDEHLDALKTLMESEGLRKCPVCTVAVERNGGCSAMECVCGATFCFWCGLKISSLEGEEYCKNPECVDRG